MLFFFNQKIFVFLFLTKCCFKKSFSDIELKSRENSKCERSHLNRTFKTMEFLFIDFDGFTKKFLFSLKNDSIIKSVFNAMLAMGYEVGSMAKSMSKFKKYLKNVKSFSRNSEAPEKEKNKIDEKVDMLIKGIEEYTGHAVQKAYSSHNKKSNEQKYEEGLILPRNKIAEVCKVSRELMDIIIENDLLMKVINIVQTKQISNQLVLRRVYELYSALFSVVFFINEMGLR